MALRSTKKQRDDLENCHPGVGLLIYNNGLNIVEVDTCLNKAKQLCCCSTGKPVQFEIFEEAKP